MAAGASCSIQVTFTPQATGPLTGEMTIYANVYGGQLTVDLNGTGAAAGVVTLTPSTVSFGQVEVGTTSTPLPVTVANSSAAAIPISSVSITAPFAIASNACGTTSLAANSDCQVNVEFAPTAAGAVTGLLTFIDGAGTQTVELTGTGEAAPTDILNPTSLTFPSTAEGQVSAALSVTITNTGDLPLTFPANRGVGERRVSAIGHQPHANCRPLGWHRQRGLRSHAAGRAHRHAHHHRRPARRRPCP